MTVQLYVTSAAAAVTGADVTTADVTEVVVMVMWRVPLLPGGDVRFDLMEGERVDVFLQGACQLYVAVSLVVVVAQD